MIEFNKINVLLSFTALIEFFLIWTIIRAFLLFLICSIIASELCFNEVANAISYSISMVIAFIYFVRSLNKIIETD